MSDPVLDVRSARALLRRRSRLLAAAAVLGLAAGGAYVALVPPTLTSTTLVLLPTPTVSGGERDVTTQVRIVLSTSVLSAAGAQQVPALDAREVRDRIRVEALTNQLVQIEARSPRARAARSLSQAVADAYVTFVREADRRVATAALTDLSQREADLAEQFQTLSKEIEESVARQDGWPTGSSEARGEGQLLGRLRAEQADVALQLDRVRGDIATGAPAGAATGLGTSVLQEASPPAGPHLVMRLATWMPLGAAATVALAGGVLLLLRRREPRMGFRDDIADAVGSPVLGAVRSHPQRSVASWRVLVGTYDATAVEAWAFRQVLRGLATIEGAQRGRTEARQRIEHPRSVCVVTLAGDNAALAVGVQLAAFAASLGIPTRLVPGPGHDRAAPLWAALSTQSTVHPRNGLTLGPEDDEDPSALTVVLAVVDRRRPDLSGVPDTTTAVVAVAALSATEQELARAAIAVDDVGRRIDGVLVADPDRADRTSGRHTLDERAARPPLPVRLTGVPSTTTSSGDPRRRR